MDLFSIKYFSKVKRLEPISAVMQAVLGIGRWLTEFFTLTEEDRINAGIHIGSKRHGG